MYVCTYKAYILIMYYVYIHVIYTYLLGLELEVDFLDLRMVLENVPICSFQ